MFRLLDRDGDGQVDPDEFKIVFQDMFQDQRNFTEAVQVLFKAIREDRGDNSDDDDDDIDSETKTAIDVGELLVFLKKKPAPGEKGLRTLLHDRILESQLSTEMDVLSTVHQLFNDICHDDDDAEETDWQEQAELWEQKCYCLQIFKTALEGQAAAAGRIGKGTSSFHLTLTQDRKTMGNLVSIICAPAIRPDDAEDVEDDATHVPINFDFGPLGSTASYKTKFAPVPNVVVRTLEITLQVLLVLLKATRSEAGASAHLLNLKTRDLPPRCRYNVLQCLLSYVNWNSNDSFLSISTTAAQILTELARKPLRSTGRICSTSSFLAILAQSPADIDHSLERQAYEVDRLCDLILYNSREPHRHALGVRDHTLRFVKECLVNQPGFASVLVPKLLDDLLKQFKANTDRDQEHRDVIQKQKELEAKDDDDDELDMSTDSASDPKNQLFSMRAEIYRGRLVNLLAVWRTLFCRHSYQFNYSKALKYIPPQHIRAFWDQIQVFLIHENKNFMWSHDLKIAALALDIVGKRCVLRDDLLKKHRFEAKRKKWRRVDPAAKVRWSARLVCVCVHILGFIRILASMCSLTHCLMTVSSFR